MKKNTIKLLSIVLLTILIICLFFSMVNAEDISFTSYGPENYDSAVDSTGTAASANNILGAIMTVAQVIGVGVAIVMLIVLAIKYVYTAPGDKAEIKKHAVVYVVGAIVLFAASGILGIIKNFAVVVTAKQ